MLEQRWPQPRPVEAAAATVEWVVQVNGKVRGKARVPTDVQADPAAVLAAVLAADVGQRWIGSSARVAKSFLVANKSLVNIVLRKDDAA